jgi:hypothetical protein
LKKALGKIKEKIDKMEDKRQCKQSRKILNAKTSAVMGREIAQILEMEVK